MEDGSVDAIVENDGAVDANGAIGQSTHLTFVIQIGSPIRIRSRQKAIPHLLADKDMAINLLVQTAQLREKNHVIEPTVAQHAHIEPKRTKTMMMQ